MCTWNRTHCHQKMICAHWFRAPIYVCDWNRVCECESEKVWAVCRVHYLSRKPGLLARFEHVERKSFRRRVCTDLSVKCLDVVRKCVVRRNLARNQDPPQLCQLCYVMRNVFRKWRDDKDPAPLVKYCSEMEMWTFSLETSTLQKWIRDGNMKAFLRVGYIDDFSSDHNI